MDEHVEPTSEPKDLIPHGKEFWENSLEVGTEVPLKNFDDDEFMKNWVSSISPRCRIILARHLGLDPSLKRKEVKEALVEHRPSFLPFLLVDAAKEGKRGYAIIKVAKSVLDTSEVLSCRLEDSDNEKYDTRALMWLLYLDDPNNLELVFHFDRTQRKGFARMVLSDRPPAPVMAPDEFFNEDRMQSILDTFEESHKNVRQSYCARVLPDDGRFKVFIKRDCKPNFVSHGADNIFGFEREWIILVFDANVRRVRISSDSPDAPTLIANLIASEFVGRDVAYINEVVEMDEDLIKQFLNRLVVTEPDSLALVEIVFKNSGLEGAPNVTISNKNNTTLATAIREFGATFGDPLERIEDVESLKIHAFKKRIKMIFEPVEHHPDLFIVRYGDQPLNTEERSKFEDLMREKYGLTVLSTEKRYAD